MVTTKVSVLIPQYGRTDLTVRAVEAVRRSRGDLEFEVLVHDNGSDGGPGPVAEDPGVVLSTSEHNLGFGPAVNAMAGTATGTHLLILNNDTVVHPDATARLVARSRSQAEVGPVVPLYRDFEGAVLELGGGLGEGAQAWQLFRGGRPPAGLATVAHRADYGSAAAMLVERDLFLRVGGFDDAFAPAYFEDTDLCLRLAAEGHPTIVEPRAVVFHFEGGTAGTDVASGLKAYQTRNRATFAARWRSELKARGPVGLHRSVQAATTPATGQPRVLWLAPTLPRRDRDGGGRRMMEMLGLLRQEGAGLAFFAQSAHDAERYGGHLGELGIPWFGGSSPSRWSGASRALGPYDVLPDLLRAAPWDVVVVSFARLARRVVDVIREAAPDAALVIDNGDLHFLRHDRARELGVEITDTLTKDEELDAYASSDGVITSSGPEDDVLRSELEGIATHVVTVAPPEPIRGAPAPDGALMFLGNFGHPPNTDAVQYWTDALAHRVAAHAGREVPLRVVGAATDALPAHPSLDVAGWIPDLADEFACTRVFFAPLRYGAGTKGKILEAMAHGVPVVTTPTGAEGFPPRVVEALLVGETDDQLALKAALLMTDDEFWARQRQRVAVAARWFHDQHATAGRALVAWLQGRVYAHRHGLSPRPGRVTAPSWPAQQAATAALVVSDGAPPHDRPFEGRPSTSVTLCPDPVFVVGAPRSGTSMMAHALGQHSQFWTGEESDFLLPLARGAREAWEFGRQRGDLQWLHAAGVSWEEFLHHLGTGMNAMYSERAEGRRWVEQTPQYTVDLPTIARMFPGARFVFMLRDGRSVAHSLTHFVRPLEHDPASRLWARFVRAGLDFLDSDQGDRLRIVRYEHVVEDAARQMKDLAEFLEVDPEPEMAAFVADRSPINSSFQGADAGQATPRWAAWSRQQREVFHAAAGDLLVQLGYEPDSSWVTT